MRIATVSIILSALLPGAVRAKRGKKSQDKKIFSKKLRTKSVTRGGGCVPGAIVVANRGSGGITVIPTDGSSQFDVEMPISDSGGIPEPMYVQEARGKVYVGCRENNEVVVFDARTYDIIKRIPAGMGVFHMWTDSNTLWVINDVDKTVTVIDTQLDKAIKTIDVSDRLASASDRPHDIVITPAGDAVYVTLFSGAVLKIDPSTYGITSINADDIAGDPHLAVTFLHNVVFVPQQGGNVLSFLDQSDPSVVTGSLPIPNAHGIGISPCGRYAYVTDIETTASALFTVDTVAMSLVGSPVDVEFETPHNVVVTNDSRLFLTHSGTDADQVAEYELVDHIPQLKETYTVGTNPFGIGYVEGNCQYY